MSQFFEDNTDDFESGNAPLQSFDFGKLLFICKNSIFHILLIGVLMGMGVFLYLRYTKPLYTAESTLKLEVKSSSNSLFNIDLQGLNAGLDIKLQGEIELLRSRKIYEGVLKQENFSVGYFLVGEILDDERFPFGPFIVKGRLLNSSLYNQHIYVSIIDDSSFKLSYQSFSGAVSEVYQFGEVIKNADLDIFIEKSKEFVKEPSEYYFKFYTTEQLIEEIDSKLQVVIINPNANTIGISYTDHNRVKAEKIVNAINDTYIIKTLELKNQAYEQSLEYLEDQINRTRDTLEHYEQQIALKAVNKDDRKNLFKDQVGLVSELNKVEEERLVLREKIRGFEYIQNLIVADSSLDFVAYAASVISNSGIGEEVSKMREAELEMKRIEKSYESSTKKEFLQESLGKSRGKILNRIQFNIQLLKSQANQLNFELRKLENALSGGDGIQKNDLELKKLERYYKSYEEMYQLLLGKRIEIGVAKASTVSNFQVLSKANASEVPISPVKSNAYLAGLVLMLFLSIALVLAKYFLQNKINNVKELSQRLKVPVLGVVPEYKKESMAHSQLVVHKNPKSSMSEAMRSIRTNLEFLKAGKQLNSKRIISITSTISGEGKTFVALNLAGVIAMADTKVVVIDLDLRKPKIHLGFGVENNVGITSILIGRANIDECLHNSEIDNLKFITAGPLPPNPSEMIMSQAFEDLLKDLQERFDVVIFDTPPVGLVTDGIIAMKYAVHGLYVLRAQYSKLEFSQNVNKLVDMHGFTNVSAILNAVNTQNTYGSDYSYGYGYGYGGGYGAGYGYYEEDEVPQGIKSWKRFIPFLK